MFWGLQHSLVLDYLQLSLDHLLCLPLHLGQNLMVAWWTFLQSLPIPIKQGTNQPMHAWSIHQKCGTVDNCPKSHGTMSLQSFHCLTVLLVSSTSEGDPLFYLVVNTSVFAASAAPCAVTSQLRTTTILLSSLSLSCSKASAPAFELDVWHIAITTIPKEWQCMAKLKWIVFTLLAYIYFSSSNKIENIESPVSQSWVTSGDENSLVLVPFSSPFWRPGPRNLKQFDPTFTEKSVLVS